MKKIFSLTLAILFCLCLTVFAASCADSKTFKVTFDLDGGVRTGGGAIIQEVESADKIVDPVVEKEGYTFVSWSVPIAGIAEDTIVKAIWEKNKITVTFSVLGGEYQEDSGALTQTVKDASSLVLPVFTRKGYTLTWDKKISEITTSCTVNGVWVPNEYKVTFLNENGGEITGLAPMMLKYEQSVGKLPVPTSTENKFVGWRLPSGYMLTEGMTWNYDQDISVTAVWTSFDRYVIKCDLNGGNEMQYPTTYIEGHGVTINSATRTGYTFLGWVELDADGNVIGQAKTVIVIDEIETGDKYYRATWQIKSYTVYFKTNNGTPSAEVMTFTYGQKVTNLPTVSGNGGTFVCWEYDGQEIKNGMNWVIDDSGIELTAKFTRKFIFTLAMETKVGVKPVSVILPEGAQRVIELSENQAINLPTAAAADKEEYTFRGWKYVNDAGKSVKLESNTVLTLSAFPDLNLEDVWTVEITLVPYCTANWSGYY